uniref:SET domain-containing protein n=1 Tax=Pristionchus pacificus TaxID=54126 RepID=A0A8R1YWD2_PRIPA
MAGKGRVLIPGLYDSSDESENSDGVDQIANDIVIDPGTPEPYGEEVIVEQEEEFDFQSVQIEQEQIEDEEEEYDPTDVPFLIRKPPKPESLSPAGTHAPEVTPQPTDAEPRLLESKNLVNNEADDDEHLDNFYFVVDVKNRSVKIISGEYNEQEFTTLEKISAESMIMLNERVYSPNPDDDDHFDCDKCVMSFRVCCIKHYPLYRILDRPVLDPKEDRAKKTLPAFIRIKTSSIPNAGLGAFTLVDLPVGIVFGPYQGILSKESDNRGYSWEIRNVDGPSTFLDGSDPKYSNWMRYINSPRHDREQNLVAFQYNGSVYYRVIKPIDVEQELLVWYGAKYGESLGVFSTKKSTTKIRSVSTADVKNPFIF